MVDPFHREGVGAKADAISALEEAGDTWLLAARKAKKKSKSCCSIL